MPILLATFFISCSKNVAIENNYEFLIEQEALIDEFYSNYPAQLFNPKAIYNSKLDIEKSYKYNEEVYNILKASKKWKYTPYKLGGTSSSKGADCSAFTKEMYKDLYNIKLERTTKYQRLQGKKISKKDIKTGDLLFFKTDGPFGLHVGIYLVNGSFIHLSSKGGTRIQSLSVAYWNKRFLEARRY